MRCGPLDRSLGSGDIGSVQMISELVKAQKAASDLSYEALAQRAQKVGLGLTKQQLSDLASSRPKGGPKSAEMVQALSMALNVPERTVVLAYAASFGIDVSETLSPFEVRLPATVSSLDTSMQDAILHVIRAATEGASHDERDVEDHEQELRTEARGQKPTQPTPMTRAGVSPAYDPNQHRFYGTKAEATRAARQQVQAKQPEDPRVSAVPRPDEYAMAASDDPSEGRALREQQDEAVESSQDSDDWGDA